MPRGERRRYTAFHFFIWAAPPYCHITSWNLEALVQPCVPPLKREAGKPEGVCEEQSRGESQGRDEDTRD